jgi:hypothetical protein
MHFNVFYRKFIICLIITLSGCHIIKND